MQILKPLLIVCVAVCTLSVRGADNAKQAKAREALQKLQGVTNQPVQTPALQPQPEQAASQTPTPPPAAPTPPPAPVPPPPAPQPALQPQPEATTTADSDAIAKAREAMRLKMQEVLANEPPPPPQAPAPAPVAPTPAPAVTETPPPTPTPTPTPVPPSTPPAAPVLPPPAVIAAPTVQPPVQPALPLAEEADPAAIAKAREALRLKMQELQAVQPEPRALTPLPAPALAQTHPPTAPVTQAPPATPAPPITAQPLPSPLTTTPAATPPPSLPNAAEEVGADPATIEKAREAVRMKMQTLPVPVDETQSGQTAGYLHRPERVTGPGNFPPLAGPALPISAAKQQQLDALLLRYKADQITPEQYHAERAKILGEQ